MAGIDYGANLSVSFVAGFKHQGCSGVEEQGYPDESEANGMGRGKRFMVKKHPQH